MRVTVVEKHVGNRTSGFEFRGSDSGFGLGFRVSDRGFGVSGLGWRGADVRRSEGGASRDAGDGGRKHVPVRLLDGQGHLPEG